MVVVIPTSRTEEPRTYIIRHTQEVFIRVFLLNFLSLCYWFTFGIFIQEINPLLLLLEDLELRVLPIWLWLLKVHALLLQLAHPLLDLIRVLRVVSIWLSPLFYHFSVLSAVKNQFRLWNPQHALVPLGSRLVTGIIHVHVTLLWFDLWFHLRKVGDELTMALCSSKTLQWLHGPFEMLERAFYLLHNIQVVDLVPINRFGRHVAVSLHFGRNVCFFVKPFSVCSWIDLLGYFILGPPVLWGWFGNL